VQFGIGYNSTSAQGILGVGYETNEAAISIDGKTYPNFPAILASTGVINTNAYSLWLNDYDANEGSILFGGVDSDKYTGELSTVPVIKEDGVYQEFIIALSSVTADNQTIFKDTPIPVLLDSGSSLSYLPDQYAEALYSIFNAKYDSTSGAATVNCNMASSSATVDFSFSGATISVPMNELVVIDGYERGKAVCILGTFDISTPYETSTDNYLRYQQRRRLHLRLGRYFLAKRLRSLRSCQQRDLYRTDRLQRHL
jgi:hypothetical protein